MQRFLNQEYFGNTLWLYGTAILIFIAGIIFINIFRSIILKRIKKWSESTDSTIDDFIIRGIEKTVIPLLYFGAFYTAVNSLILHPKLAKALSVVSVILVTFFIIKLIISVLKYIIHSYLAKKGQLENREKQLRGIITLGSFFIWAIGFIFLLDNLGFEISAVIAGLGIGGIAIALAAQTILGDLFSYFVIFFDRPFQIGDFIILSSDKLGSIEYIGIKTTRIRSLSGEQLIISNTDLVNSRIHNYKRMERRRVIFKLGIVYSTPYEKVAEAGKLLKEIVEGVPDTTFDRAHFISYGDFSLIYEVVYYVLSSDYNKYADAQQEINLKIYKEFESRGIEFAFPTQTLYLNKVNGIEEPKTEVVSR
ncbi:MAG: mechanosensitive ion channel [Ignavibacteriaceae bacterium]